MLKSAPAAGGKPTGCRPILKLLAAACLLLTGCSPALHPVVARDVAVATRGKQPESIEAVERLGRYGDPGIDGLILLLTAKAPEIRLAVVIELGRQLSRLSAPDSPPKASVSEDLENQFPKEISPSDKSIEAKHQRINRISAALIRANQREQAWTIRRVIIAVIGKSEGTEVDSALISALEDQHPAVRQQAGVALLGRSAALDPILLSALGQGGDQTTKFILALIGRRQIKNGLPRVLEYLEDENWEIRSQAMLTLFELKADSDPAISALIRHLNDPNPRAALYAARALIAIGREDGIQAAIRRFPDKDLINDFEKIEKKPPAEEPANYREAPPLEPGISGQENVPGSLSPGN